MVWFCVEEQEKGGFLVPAALRVGMQGSGNEKKSGKNA